jgi:hypothetical protein
MKTYIKNLFLTPLLYFGFRVKSSLNKNFMKTITSLTFLAFTFCTAFLDTAWAQPLTVTTIAGQYGNTISQNGIGTNALFGRLGAISADKVGNLYVIDAYAVRKISPNLTVTIFAGNPTFPGSSNGTNALFQNPVDIAVDKNGYIYVADLGNHTVRKISPSGVVSTLAGNGSSGYIDATGTSAEFMNLNGIAVDSSGNVYVSDYGTYNSQTRYVIRKITADGVVSTLAGGSRGYNDGVGAAAQFYSPKGLAVDAGGTVYVADSFGIRKVAPDGTVTTWAGDNSTQGMEYEQDGIGANAGFAGASAIALDRSGGAYVTDELGETIRYIYSPAGVVSTVAGLANTPPTINNDGVGSDARFINPYGITVDTAGNVFITDSSARTFSSGATVLKGVPPSLSPIDSVSESAGITPIRSNNPWQFTAHFTNIVSGLRLRVQSTTTPTVEGSWTDLPDAEQWADKDGNWTLNTTDVPTGVQYFRVVASAPGYFDSASVAEGPETVLEGIAPFGFFFWQTTRPERNGALWTFWITEPSLISDLRLRIQSSPDNLSSWSDLPDGGQMGDKDATWTLNTTNLPLGQQFFRVVASAPTYFDRISESRGPFNIEAALTTITKTTSGAGYHVLDLNADSDMQDPALMVYAMAVMNADVQFIFTGNIDQFAAALSLAGEKYASAELIVGKNQTLIIPAVNAGPNASLVDPGTITGDVSLIGDSGSTLIGDSGSTLIGNGGSTLIGNGGSTLTSDAGTKAAVVSNDGGSLIGEKGAGLISQDSAGIVSAGGGNIVSAGGGNIVSAGGGNMVSAGGGNLAGQLTPRPKSPTPTQPTFTGQMTINGNYSQFPGTALIIGIAGTNTLSDGAQQYDQLVVSGQANLLGGTIAFGLFNPDDQTNLANVFQPPDGATFDVVVASNIVVNALHLLGPVWGDGLFFKGGVVTLTNGLQAVRLMATHIPPRIFLQNAGPELHLLYGTNYTGYTVQSSTNLSDWSAFSTGTNVVVLPTTNASQFFRLSKP